MGEKTVFKENDKACHQCRYFDTLTNFQSRQQVTVCRARPPTVVAQALPQQGIDPATNQPTIVGIQWNQATVWPVVTNTDWCAEFNRKVTQ